MVRLVPALLALSFASTAHAGVEACFTDEEANPLIGMRLTVPGWFGATEHETDDDGCAVLTTDPWTSALDVDVHATNRVVTVQNLAIPVVETLYVVDGGTYDMGEDFRWAEVLRQTYDITLRGFGPFEHENPWGGSLIYGPHVPVDIDSPFIVEQIYVEPLAPRMHLESGEPTYWDEGHELAHALMFGSWSLATRTAISADYLAYLNQEDNIHEWDAPSTEMVAFIEAFGGMGGVLHDHGQGESEYLDGADGRAAALRAERSGDVAIEGVVFGILYHELAMRWSLSEVIDTVLDCEQITLHAYANCMADTYGRSSSTYLDLRESAWVYGVVLDGDPAGGDWDFCGDGFLCEREEGDCDSSADCAGDLSCLHDVGADYGWSSAVDVCGYPEGHGNFCTPDFPCTSSQGDCDSDDDCSGNLVCAHNIGASYGHASWVDICVLPARG